MMYLVRHDNSDMRILFDKYFHVKEVLKSDQYVTLQIENLPSPITTQLLCGATFGLNPNSISEIKAYTQKGSTYCGRVTFTSYENAHGFYIQFDD